MLYIIFVGQIEPEVGVAICIRNKSGLKMVVRTANYFLSPCQRQTSSKFKHVGESRRLGTGNRFDSVPDEDDDRSVMYRESRSQCNTGECVDSEGQA